MLRRPDVQAAWLRIAVADQELAAALADRFPRLVLGATGSTGARDVSALMQAVMSERVRLDGAGPLLAALLAADRRGARRVTVLELTSPAGAVPGRLGALVTRA